MKPVTMEDISIRSSDDEFSCGPTLSRISEATAASACTTTSWNESFSWLDLSSRQQDEEDHTNTSKSALDARLKEELNSCGLNGSSHLKYKHRRSHLSAGSRLFEEPGEIPVALLLLIVAVSVGTILLGAEDIRLMDSIVEQVKGQWKDLLGVATLATLAFLWPSPCSPESSPEEKRGDLLLKADHGDVQAMEWMGKNSELGENGFRQDLDRAFKWYEKAAKAGSTLGMAKVGEFLVHKRIKTSKRNRSKGFTYLGMAAAQGSDLAAFGLAKVFSEGPEADLAEAVFWLQKVTSGSCEVQHLDEPSKQEAIDILDQLQRRAFIDKLNDFVVR